MRTLRDAIGRTSPAAWNLVRGNADLIFAVVATWVFWVQSLRNKAVDAGYLYTGDVLGYYLPLMAKIKTLLSGWHFTALDFSSYNGSSDFFLTANMFSVHPFVVLYSLLTPAGWTSMNPHRVALTLIIATHTGIMCFFAQRLMSRFFGFGFWQAAFVGVTFAFSHYTIHGVSQPSFLFSTAVLPWAAYLALRFATAPNLPRFLWACLPPICGVLGGYGPIGLASLALSLLLVVAALSLGTEHLPRPILRRRLGLAVLPYLGAASITAPYLYAMLSFNRETSSGGLPSLFFSAFQLSENPQTLLRMLSPNYLVPGPFYEFSIMIGIGMLAIFVMFFSSRLVVNALSAQHAALLHLGFAVFILSALAIFGQLSAVSSLLYYFVPVIGWTHIYQRFLFPSSLFLCIAAAIALQALIVSRPPTAPRIMAALFGGATLAACYVVARLPGTAQEIGLNGNLIMELLYALLIALALTLPGRNATCAAILFLVALPPLQRYYTYSHFGNTQEAMLPRAPMALDPAQRAALVDWLKRKTDKTFVKYMDVTPAWTAGGVETFPKSFPYFVLGQIDLSSYIGFSFYLAGRQEYMKRMPIMGAQVMVQPDWDLALDQGADFAIVPAARAAGTDLRGILAPDGVQQAYRLPNDVLVVPLQRNGFRGAAPSFDNGMVRVRPGVAASDGDLPNVALNRPATQSSGDNAGRAVDGNTDGDYGRSSVTHTGRDADAWLDVDLGESRNVERVVVWNRTDAVPYRLGDYWVLLSEQPFEPNVSAERTATRPGVWSRHLRSVPSPDSTIRTGGERARYVRVQLGGTLSPEESFLSLAELQVFASATPGPSTTPPPAPGSATVTRFETNKANYLRTVIEASGPSTFSYLFSPNPRARFYLDGRRVVPTLRDGVLDIEVPAGRSEIEMVYRHPLLATFWVLYGLYGLAVLVFCLLLPAWLLARAAWWRRPIRTAPALQS